MSDKEYEEARDRLLIKLAPLLNEVGEDLNIVLEYVEKLEAQRGWLALEAESHDSSRSVGDWLKAAEEAVSNDTQ